MSGPPPRRYVLLPREGMVAPAGPAADVLRNLPHAVSTRASMSGRLRALSADVFDEPEPEGPEVRVVDTVSDDGPHLVELDAAAAEELTRGDSPVRAVPELEYPPPLMPLSWLAEEAAAPVAAAGAAAADAATLAVTCTDAVTGRGVAGAVVVAFTDYARKQRGRAVTDASGVAQVPLKGPTVERLYVRPPATGYWGAFRHTLPASEPVSVQLAPIDLAVPDSVRHYYASSRFDAAAGVVVGILDTGVGDHPDLNVVSGENTVTGETATDYADLQGHGTHVAGLVGSRGAPPAGVRGIAPDVRLRAYRVFPAKSNATNYAVLKALIAAARDGCDIVNLSLGGGPRDQVVEEAIVDARNKGMLVVVATGNKGRAPVDYPGAYRRALAVTAIGRQGTFPPGSSEEAEAVRPPMGTDPDEFVAGFANVGPEVDAAAPGVGVVSTMPGGGFGVLSGTSMAAPVVSGAAACLLSRDPVVQAMPRDAARADAIESLLTASLRPRGFGAVFEGKGMPDPAAL